MLEQALGGPMSNRTFAVKRPAMASHQPLAVLRCSVRTVKQSEARKTSSVACCLQDSHIGRTDGRPWRAWNNGCSSLRGHGR